MLPTVFWAVLAGLLGLAIGSFLNVVIYRVPAGESVVSPPSRCPRCGNQIRNRHNVPVLGWLVLRGRCADCGLPISPRYPLVEGATGVGFAVIAAVLVSAGRGAAVPACLAAFAFALVLAMIAVDGNLAPRSIVVPAYALVAVLLVVASVVEHRYWALAWSVIGGAVLGLVALAARATTRSVPLAILVGGVLAWFV